MGDVVEVLERAYIIGGGMGGGDIVMEFVEEIALGSRLFRVLDKVDTDCGCRLVVRTSSVMVWSMLNILSTAQVNVRYRSSQ